MERQVAWISRMAAIAGSEIMVNDAGMVWHSASMAAAGERDETSAHAGRCLRRLSRRAAWRSRVACQHQNGFTSASKPRIFLCFFSAFSFAAPRASLAWYQRRHCGVAALPLKALVCFDSLTFLPVTRLPPLYHRISRVCRGGTGAWRRTALGEQQVRCRGCWCCEKWCVDISEYHARISGASSCRVIIA